MANRRPQNGGGRRMDFGRNDRGKNFGRSGVSPWQGGGPGGGLPNLLPLAGGSTEATLALASNIINLLQPRQNPVPSLLDMPIRRDFGPAMGRFDRPYIPNRMGNQGNYRRTGNYSRAGERFNTNRKPFKPNDGQRQQNKSSPKKEADSKAKPAKESDQDEKNETVTTEQTGTKEEEVKKETPKTRYDDISPQFLKCHICNKSMWDGRSFENHLNGRAHAIMMQKTAESYALTADTMRQEFKIREMKRTRKTGQQPARDFYCAMCDMYAADGAVHRTTVGHRKLKKYLHPTCTSCHKEMPTRIELDEHRLTSEHLKNMHDKQDVTAKPKPEVMVISTLNMEQLYLREDRQRRRRDDKPDGEAPGQEPEGNITNKSEDQEEIEIKKEKSDDVEVKQEPEEDQKIDGKCDEDSENTILDYKEGEDLSNITPDMIPAYSTERGVGRSFLSEFRCVQCRLCRKLLDSEATAAVHLRTWRHHQLFQRMLADKCSAIAAAHQQNQDAAAKRPLNSEESGNWKRRKTSVDNDNEDHDNEDELNGDRDIIMKEEQQVDESAACGADTDTHIPPLDQVEDWEQSVDEILEDELVNNAPNTDKEKQKPQPEPEKPLKEVLEETKTPPIAPAASVAAPPAVTPAPRGTPRSRARARGGGRVRY